jgi:hypothetical protein
VVIGARRRSAAAVRHRGRAGRGRVRADGPSGWGDRLPPHGLAVLPQIDQALGEIQILRAQHQRAPRRHAVSMCRRNIRLSKTAAGRTLNPCSAVARRRADDPRSR